MRVIVFVQETGPNPFQVIRSLDHKMGSPKFNGKDFLQAAKFIEAQQTFLNNRLKRIFPHPVNEMI